MARRALDIRIRIERQEKKILKLRKQLEEAQEQYDQLMQEQKEEDKARTLQALSRQLFA